MANMAPLETVEIPAVAEQCVSCADASSQLLEKQGQRHKIRGLIEVQASMANVMNVLCRVTKHPSIFSSILHSEVLRQEGVEADVLQVGKWQLMWLSGQFKNIVHHTTHPEKGSMQSRVMVSSLFREYVASWQVKEGPHGCTSIQHDVEVTPKQSVPPGLGGMLTSNLLHEEDKMLQELKRAAEGLEKQ